MVGSKSIPWQGTTEVLKNIFNTDTTVNKNVLSALLNIYITK